MKEIQEYLFGELGKHFKIVEPYQNSLPHDAKFWLVHVSNDILTPGEFTPFVIISVDREALSRPGVDLAQIVAQGVEHAREIIQRPPVPGSSYQGTIYMGEGVWFSYQGLERRERRDRRFGDRRRRARRRERPETSLVVKRERRSGRDRRRGDEEDEGRRKGERRRIPIAP